MDDQTKRLFLASGLCLAVLLIWTRFFMPPPPPSTDATTQPTSQRTRLANGEVTSDRSAMQPSRPATGDGAMALGGPATYAEGADEIEPEARVLGSDEPTDDNPFLMRVEVTSLQAAIREITLKQHRARVAKKGEAAAPAYVLLRPVEDSLNQVEYNPFAVQKIQLLDTEIDVDMRDLSWRVGSVQRNAGPNSDAHQVSLTATVFDQGVPILELTRIFTLPPQSRHLLMRWEAKSLSPRPLRFAIVEDGPMGFEQADSRFDKPRVMTALIDDAGDIGLATSYVRSDVYKAEDRRIRFVEGEDHILWSAVSNKYFTCIVYAAPNDGDANYANFVGRVVAKAHVAKETEESDLTFEQWIAPVGGLAANATFGADFEIYCGAKRDQVFESIPAAVARNYHVVKAPDGSACTFDALSALMRWLLVKIHGVLGNYGIAIIVLVIIVRTILHPVTKKSQLNMLKMQKNSKRLQPKIKSLQKQFKNDKQKLQEETMKLYREEGVNPASTVLGCLPMLLQTPVWIALYTTLNTDVSIRHQPFIGYIRDLSSPDVLYDFAGSFTLPLLGAVMGPISAIHLLPVLMSIVMIMQMKLSQKMAAANKEKDEAEKANAAVEAEEPAEENPMAEAMEKNQKMMIYIMPFFGLLFYNMPSGLCLYILSNSLLGMGELHYIRKQLRDLEERGELAPKKKQRDPNKPKGRLQTFLEDAQRRAEEARKAQGGGSGGISAKHMPGNQKRKKKPRF